MQQQLRGIIAFAVCNGYFPYALFSTSRKGRRRIKDARIEWVCVKVSSLFEVTNGHGASSFRLLGPREADAVPLFRPTSDMHNLVAGWIKRSKDIDKKICPAGSLMVSTDGEGSHTYSYITPIEFIPNSNTVVLEPKCQMPLSFLLFISIAITNERWRYSYGRKPKGDRLKNLLLRVPIKDTVPDVKAFESMVKSIPEYEYVLSYFSSNMEGE